MFKVSIEEVLKNVSGCSFVGIDTITPVKLSGGKSNPLQGKVMKRTIGSNIQVFQNKNSNGYENAINKRLESEGKIAKFEVSERTWGERIKNTPFIQHNGKNT